MAQNLDSNVQALMNTMLKKFGRLFIIKTRWEAWFVIWAIALGAVERGRVYLETYHGFVGWMFFAACTGVVFLAGAKLLDSVRPAPAAVTIGPFAAPQQRRVRSIRNRPRARPAHFGSRLPSSLHID
jgi:hypothetical protein